MSLAISPRLVHTQDEEGGGQRVGEGGGGCDHGSAEHALGGPAGAGIEDMPQPAALVFQVLEGGRRRAQSLVLEPDHRQATLGAHRMADADGPARARAGLAAQSEQTTVAAVYQAGRYVPIID